MPRLVARTLSRSGLATLLTATALGATASSASAASLLTVNDDTTGIGPAGANCAAPDHATIGAAVAAAIAGDTVAVCEGTYPESIVVDKRILFMGAQADVDARNRVAPESVIDATGAHAIEASAAIVVNGMKLTGATGAALDFTGAAPSAQQNVRDNIFTGNGSAASGPFGNEGRFVENHIQGSSFRGIEVSGGPQESIAIRENLFEGITDADMVFAQSGTYADVDIAHNVHASGSGHFVSAFNIADLEITRNTVAASGATVLAFFGANHGVLIRDNTISGGGVAPGITIENLGSPTGKNSGFDVTSNTITGTPTGVHAFSSSMLDDLEMHRNRIVGNAVGVANDAGSGGPFLAENNWWGCNGGPGAPGCNTTSGDVSTTPHIVLTLTASPTSIQTGGDTASLRASVRTNSAGSESGPDFPTTTPVAFSTTLGTLAASTTLVKAIADGTLTSGNTPGTATVEATLDNQTVSAPVTIEAVTLPGPPGPTPPPFCANRIKGKNVADVLIGTPNGDLIKGKRGDDKIKGRGAQDCLVGGKGRDKIGAVDGVQDRINCGAGRDRVKVDSKDLLKPNCEKIKVKG